MPRIDALAESGDMSKHLESMMRQFGKRLAAARLVAGYEDAKSFALDIGIKEPRYRRYERGEAFPPIDILHNICRVTGKSADFLIFGAEHHASDRR